MMYLPCTKASVLALTGLSLAAFAPLVHSQPYTFNTYIGSATNAGSADGTNGAAQFISPTGLALDSSGAVYVADGNAIRSITVYGTNRVVRTLVGSVGSHAFVDGTNTTARLNAPQGVATDSGGALYVADTFNNAIRKVARSGTNWIVTTVAGPAPPGISPPFGTNDGINNAARFHNPYGIAVDVTTNLYVADSLNQTIRKITLVGTNWVVATIAGLPGSSGSANGSNEVARFNSPSSLAVDTNGVIYVADLGNNTIRKITQIGTNWAVTTLAGSPGFAGSVDGAGLAARFNQPQQITLDAGQNLYVTDSGNYTVRRITPAGFVTTIAGLAGVPGSADGTGAAARFQQPFGVAVDPTGLVYVADYLGYSIRMGGLAAVLQCARAGNSLILFWASGLTRFAPETCGQFPNGGWTPLATNTAVVSEPYVYLTNGLSGGPAFFRLHRTMP